MIVAQNASNVSTFCHLHWHSLLDFLCGVLIVKTATLPMRTKQTMQPFRHAPQTITHNGKTLYLRQPTRHEIEEAAELKRSAAERRKAEKDALEAIIISKRAARV
jgi:hypothetical protein